MGRGILSLHLDVIAGALQIPEGYKLLSIHYDAATQMTHLLIGSEHLEEPTEGASLPRLSLLDSVEYVPHEYRKVTTRIEKG